MNNPFSYGRPARGTSFIGRKKEIQRIVRHILEKNSIILTAEPRLGKTSLLCKVQEPELYDSHELEILHFQYLDAQTLVGWDIKRFWEYALAPFLNTHNVREAYNSVSVAGFDLLSLKQFFFDLEKAGLCLVLLLDEFDHIMEEPGLNNAEFYGTLRHISTNYNSLCLILSARQTLDELQDRTSHFTAGSPYFNFIVDEISLRVFSPEEIKEALKPAGIKFSEIDYDFISRISGGHPFFLTAAAHFLWEAYLHSKAQTPSERFVWTSEQLLNIAIPVLKDTWQAWSPYKRMAFTLAALDEMPHILPHRQFDLNRLLKDSPDFAPEQRLLKNRGFLREDPTLPGGYAPQAAVMTWFLVEELTRVLRPEDPDISVWLSNQEWEGILKHGQKQSIQKALLSLKPILKGGAIAFIKVFADSIANNFTY